MPRGAAADEIRRIIDRGLARYGRGELRGAIEEWQEVLRRDAGNLEARALIDFVRPKIEAIEGDGAGGPRRTEPVMPAFAEGWSDQEHTDPEDPPLLDLPEAGEPEGRKAQATVSSPIPTLLAKTTAPEWTPVVEREDGAPEAPLHHEDTRRLGSDAHSLVDDSMVPPTVELPVEDPAREARRRASELIDRCRAAYGRGKLDDAAGAAEQALRVGEEAPEPGIPEVIEPARSLFEQVFAAYVGSMMKVPVSAMTLDALADQDLDHRAGFLLSRIDGSMNIEQLVDVASMPKAETMRVLAALKRVGAIKLV